MHFHAAQHRMVAATEHRRQAGTQDRCRRFLHSFTILIDDDGARGFGRHEFQDPVGKLQPGIAQTRFARYAAIGKLILLPDKGKGLAALQVAAKVDLPCKKGR